MPRAVRGRYPGRSAFGHLHLLSRLFTPVGAVSESGRAPAERSERPLTVLSLTPSSPFPGASLLPIYT